MASVDWKKYKTAGDVKARLRHDCQDTRENTKQHQNPHINKAMTNQNTGVWTEYKDARERFEKRLAEVTDGKTVRKDAVRGVGFNIPAPEGLTPDKEDAWFARALDIMGERYGLENVCCYTIHRDEVHDYYDTEKQAWCKSRVHAQGILVPEVDGSLCAKKVTARGRMMELNEAIDQMSRDEFGLAFMDGTKRKSRGDTEKLKAESLKAELELKEQELKAKEKALADMDMALRGRQLQASGVNRQIEALEARKKALEDTRAPVHGTLEQPLTSDERAVLGYLRAVKSKATNRPLFEDYLTRARDREKRIAEAEAAKRAEARQKIADEARRVPVPPKVQTAPTVDAREAAAQQTERYKKLGIRKPSARRLPDLSHIEGYGNSYDDDFSL